MMWGCCLGWTELQELCKLRDSEDPCDSNQPIILLANGTALSNFELVKIYHGEPLEVFCVGVNSNLRFLKMHDSSVQTTLVNNTTARMYVETPTEGLYVCQYNKSTNRNDYTYFGASFGLHEEVENFTCKSMHFEYLNCSWVNNHFSKQILYYVDKGIPKILCKVAFFKTVNVCVWDKTHPILGYEESERNLTFIMNACFLIDCTNQTFVFDHLALVKYRAPELKLLSKSAYKVVLEFHPNINRALKSTFLELKIVYWYSGMRQNQPNIGLSRNLSNYHDLKFNLYLELPCANELYEVRAFIRHQLDVGEAYWSDPAIIHFITAKMPEEVNATVDPTCNQPRANVTQDVMLYLIAERIEIIKAEQNELKLNIESLRLKAGHGELQIN